jgi:hypothetical protein
MQLKRRLVLETVGAGRIHRQYSVSICSFLRRGGNSNEGWGRAAREQSIRGDCNRDYWQRSFESLADDGGN